MSRSTTFRAFTPSSSVIAVCNEQAEVGVSFDDARQDAVTDCDVTGYLGYTGPGGAIPDSDPNGIILGPVQIDANGDTFDDSLLKPCHGIHWLENRGDLEFEIECHSPIFDFREVTDSGGHREMRHVIQSKINLGGISWPIELTLTNRDTMRFRMLLGRRAMVDRFVVDPAASYLSGKLRPRKLYGL